MLHIRPWEIRDRLSLAEFDAACRYIDAQIDESKKAEREAKSRG